MINKIWSLMIIVGISFCFLNGKTDIINQEILESGKTTLDLIIQIFPVMALWLGIMNIAKKSGLLNKLSTKLSPLLRKIFPDIPEGHESLSLIASNIIANMFGLGNAATPIGIKAMKSLQTLNTTKNTATRSMITFLIINTSGITIIPTTIISMRMMHHSKDPTSIVFTCFLATFFSMIIGLIIDKIFAKRYKK